MKKKMDELTKYKLVYSVELAVFAVAFMIIGLLQITHVIILHPFFIQLFNWVTMFGSIWVIFDLCWTLRSEKRRKKVSLFDKVTLGIFAIYVFIIDIIMFTNYLKLPRFWYQTLIGDAVFYIGIIYIMQAYWHYRYPVPSIVEAVEQERIDKITYKIGSKEDGVIIATNVVDNKTYKFENAAEVKEEVGELFCLDLYPSLTPTEFVEEKKEEENKPQEEEEKEEEEK